MFADLLAAHDGFLIQSLRAAWRRFNSSATSQMHSAHIRITNPPLCRGDISRIVSAFRQQELQEPASLAVLHLSCGPCSNIRRFLLPSLPRDRFEIFPDFTFPKSDMGVMRIGSRPQRVTLRACDTSNTLVMCF